MKLPAMLVGILLPVTFVHPSDAVTRIDGDMGGPLGEYLLMFATIRDSGEQVIIDGRCFSACTLVTALIPRDRVCITQRAALGFHAGWFEDKGGKRVVSPTGTQVLYQMYPPFIRNWITRHGGLGRRTIIMQAQDLAAFYRNCE
jgi:hypothetical protein